MSELPNGWAEARLTEIIDLHDSRRIPLNKEQRQQRQGPYPYYGANGLVDHINGYLFDGDYVLLAEDGGYFDDPARGVAYEASGKFWVNNHAHILSPRGDIPNRFLTHLLNSISWLPHVGGSTRLKLTQAGMQQIPVPVPPLSEQRRIVAKLDSLRARSARARHELNRVPKVIERYKQAILAKAFSGVLTEEWRTIYGVALHTSYSASGIDGRIASELPELPEAWAWTSVDQAAVVTGGLTKNSKRSEIPSRAKYLRVANVYSNELRLDDIAEIGCTTAELSKTRLADGDLLIVEGNGSLDQIGRVALWGGQISDCSHQNHIIRARPLPSTVPKYGLYWLLSPIGRTAIERVASSSSGLHTLSISKVSALPIPMCIEEEQAEIVRRIDLAFAWLDKIVAEHARAEHLLPKLDQAILAKAFRGELVPQDPNDEPAPVLLERIKAEGAGADQPGRRRARA